MDVKRIVITGVSRGLGLALTEEFTAGGHLVSGCSRSADAVNRMCTRFPAPNRFHVVDVSDDRQVEAWADAVIADTGPPDLLLNNAAVVTENARLWEVPAADFSQIVDINIKGVYHVVRHFVPAMIERGSGVIVNFSSAWGRSTSPQVAPYCATKWAVEGLTRALADELPFGLAAIPLNPGIIHTEMLETCFGEHASQYPDPGTWAKKAAPFLLQLGPDDSGDPLTAPS